MRTTPELQVGDEVLVTDGPFAEFTGPVRCIDHERERVRLVVRIFGDDTVIDVPLDTVEKVTGS
ncbi:KOW motif-containing protein [Streptomyces sp. ID01-12c]|uniref:KOW motif-containing protein n=1 Tax=Streptomyces caniscabiei TaxID=2746961 RepID=A0A927L4I8_9ACTN|nr:KOW motif-containing protein [Streptomyces caniscabiei]MBD9703909.1 KOW motif-containing protein [Streptomyces caniscabiei]MBD9724746.1 KOW motif-containing protein [Streptomyces caniscabiei]MDX3508160.1 KOW motif-containing protein [Streptomyces caniscabiei]MDX3718122.1 KOW motif-containing protein [Streptomyces caniscabiei]MDX3726258.1 KOW motif-containing protein [Streptomyces caniscabiei]